MNYFLLWHDYYEIKDLVALYIPQTTLGEQLKLCGNVYLQFLRVLKPLLDVHISFRMANHV